MGHYSAKSTHPLLECTRLHSLTTRFFAGDKSEFQPFRERGKLIDPKSVASMSSSFMYQSHKIIPLPHPHHGIKSARAPFINLAGNETRLIVSFPDARKVMSYVPEGVQFGGDSGEDDFGFDFGDSPQRTTQDVAEPSLSAIVSNGEKPNMSGGEGDTASGPKARVTSSGVKLRLEMETMIMSVCTSLSSVSLFYLMRTSFLHAVVSFPDICPSHPAFPTPRIRLICGCFYARAHSQTTCKLIPIRQ